MTNIEKHITSIRDVVLIRTDRVDESVLRFVEELKHSVRFEVCLVVDTLKVDPAELAGLNHVGVCSKLYSSMDLFVSHDTLWRCGDYCLIAARQHYLQARFFWLIERDVYVNTDSLEAFLSRLNTDQLDFTASRYYESNMSWVWFGAMTAFASTIYQCVFPFVGVSGRAVDALARERRSASSAYSSKNPTERGLWPNDEVFVATTLSNLGFACRDLNEVGHNVYTRQTLKLSPPVSLKRMKALPSDNLVYHPVLEGAEFFSKLQTRVNADLRKETKVDALMSLYNDTVFQDLAAECGEETSSRYRDEFLAAVTLKARCPA